MYIQEVLIALWLSLFCSFFVVESQLKAHQSFHALESETFQKNERHAERFISLYGTQDAVP